MSWDVEDNIFLLPGPVKVHPRVARAAMVPPIAHRSADFGAVVRRMDAGLKALFQTRSSAVFAMTASATAAMEAAVRGLARRGDRVLVAHNGKFGQRFAEIARQAVGDRTVEVPSAWGAPLDVAAIEAALAKHRAGIVAMVANESSTTVRNPVEQIAEVCRRHDAMLIVDGVTAYGGMDVPTEKLGIDVAICGSQKAIGAQPGLAFVALSERAQKAMRPAGYYLDLPKHVATWNDGTTPFTPATHLYLGAAEALDMLTEEGLSARIARTSRMAQSFRAAVAGLDLRPLAPSGHESPTLTGAWYPDGIQEDQVRGELQRTWGIVVAGGQAELKGRVFRVAHMGFVQARELAACAVALESCLARASGAKPTGAAAAAFARAWVPSS